jgi:peptide/nickel transport system substrate-binding protein
MHDTSPPRRRLSPRLFAAFLVPAMLLLAAGWLSTESVAQDRAKKVAKEEEEEPVPKKKAVKKQPKGEEEDPAPVKKAGKKSSRVEEEEDAPRKGAAKKPRTEEEEDTPKKKTGKKPVREEEEEPAAKKGSAKKPSRVEEEEDTPRKGGPKKRVRVDEEEEPTKPRSKVPRGRVEDEGAAGGAAKPAADAAAVDLSQEVERAKNPAIQDFFRRLAVEHDEVVMPAGRVEDVELIPQYVGKRPAFRDKLTLQTVSKDGRPTRRLVVTAKQIDHVDHYEQVAINEAEKLLQGGVPKAESLPALHRGLAAVLRFHESAWEQGLREGEGWEDLKTALSDELVKVRIERMNALADEGKWDAALELGSQLAEAYADKPKVQTAVARLRLRRAEKSLQGSKAEEFKKAREILEELEQRFPGNSEVEKEAAPLRRQLRDKAAQLMGRAKNLEKKPDQQAAAAALLAEAEKIWPELPGLRDQRLRLTNAYPVLYVGVRSLPPRDRQQLSPATAVTEFERQAVELVFESLVRPAYDSRIGQYYEPSLADVLPRPVPLGRQFRLTAGARWFNPTKDKDEEDDLVTAADVGGTVRLLRQREGGSAEWADLIAQTDVRETFRVRIGLNQGYFDPLSLMSFKVLPVALLKKRADDPEFARQPVGSGPFYYAGRERAGMPPAEYVVFKANPNYGTRPGKTGLPQIREVRFFAWTSPEKELKEGRLHVMLDVPTKQFLDLQAEDLGLRGVVTFHTLPSRRIHFLAVNHRRTALQNPQLRRAIALAIDRTKLLNDSFRLDQKEARNFHRPLNGPFPAGSWACDDKVKADLYDLNRAKALAESAKGPAVRLKLLHPTEDEAKRACEYIRIQLKELNIEVDFQEMSPERLRQAVERDCDYDLAYYSYDYRDENYWLWPLFDPQGTERGGSNYMGYVNDDLFLSYFQEMRNHRQFTALRNAAHELHNRFLEMMPFIPLWQLDTHVIIHNDVGTFPPKDQLDPLRVFGDIDQWTLESK